MTNPDHPFAQILLVCCHADPSSKSITTLTQRLQDLDAARWEQICSYAYAHGVFPLFFQALRTHAAGVLSTAQMSFAQELQTQIAHLNMFKSAELIALDKGARLQELSFLAIKGPVLAQILYGDVTKRQFGDLDLFVRRGSFRPIAALLIDRGYTPYHPVERYQGDKVLFEMNNDCEFFDPERGQSVEVHWDFFRKLALPTARFHPWEATQTVTLNGYPVETLRHETHLLYHTLHGTKHLWERMGWIVDIDRYVRAVPTLDWEAMTAMARSMGAQRMFYSGIALAHHLFDTPLPPEVIERCDASRPASLIAHVTASLERETPSPEETLTKLLKVIGLRDTLTCRLRTLAEYLFRPGVNERRLVILPDPLFGLYWILRPLGMAWRFVVCRLLRQCGEFAPR